MFSVILATTFVADVLMQSVSDIHLMHSDSCENIGNHYTNRAATNSVHVYAVIGFSKASFILNDDTNGHYFSWGDSKNSGKVTYNQHVYANQDNITKKLCAGFSTKYANQFDHL